jgi:hypothetical protein
VPSQLLRSRNRGAVAKPPPPREHLAGYGPPPLSKEHGGSSEQAELRVRWKEDDESELGGLVPLDELTATGGLGLNRLSRWCAPETLATMVAWWNLA